MTPQQALGGGPCSRPFPKPCAHFAQRRRRLLLTAGKGEGGFRGNLAGPLPPPVPSIPPVPASPLRSPGRAARPRHHPRPPSSLSPGALRRRRGGREPICACAGCGAFLALSGAQPPEAAGTGGRCYGDRPRRREGAGPGQGPGRARGGTRGPGQCPGEPEGVVPVPASAEGLGAGGALCLGEPEGGGGSRSAAAPVREGPALPGERSLR